MLVLHFCSFRWCGPCKALTPRLENVIAKRNGKVNLAKVDIDDLGEIAAKFEVYFVKFILYLFILQVIIIDYTIYIFAKVICVFKYIDYTVFLITCYVL